MDWGVALIGGLGTLLAALGGSAATLWLMPSNRTKIQAEAGKVKTENAALLIETSLKVIDALNQQVERTQIRAETLEKHLSAAQTKMAELELSLDRVSARAEAYEERFGALE